MSPRNAESDEQKAVQEAGARYGTTAAEISLVHVRGARQSPPSGSSGQPRGGKAIG